MSSHQAPTSYTYSQTTAPTRGIVGVGLAGAAIVGAVAAAKEAHFVKEGTKTKSEAARAIAQEALGGGLATAAGAIVGGTFFRSNVLGLAAMVAVAAGVKYAYDGALACKLPAKEKTEKKATKKA